MLPLARTRRLVPFLIALALSGTVSLREAGAADPAAARSAPVGVGDLAPDFTLYDQDGVPHTLSAAVAKQDAAVLVFYRGHW